MSAHEVTGADWAMSSTIFHSAHSAMSTEASPEILGQPGCRARLPDASSERVDARTWAMSLPPENVMAVLPTRVPHNHHVLRILLTPLGCFMSASDSTIIPAQTFYVKQV